MASTTATPDASSAPYSIDVSVPPRLYIVPGWAMVVGTLIGGVRGSRAAGLRFLAENAHRPPRTVQGWYFYNKTKNYRMMLAGLRDGGSLAAKLGFIALGWVTFEELLERAGYGDVREIGAGMGTAGLVAGVYRLPLRTTYQAGMVGLVAGGTMRALRFVGEEMEGQRRAMSRDVEGAVDEGGEERGRVAKGRGRFEGGETSV